MKHLKNCNDDINFLALRYNHDQFNWSQEVLIHVLYALSLDPHINLEENRIDAIVRYEAKVINIEHKFITFLTKRSTTLKKIIKNEQPKIKRKNIDILFITTLTMQQPNTDEFLSICGLCLHIVELFGDYVTTTQAKEVATAVIKQINAEMDEGEIEISPVEAKILAMTEFHGKQLKIFQKDLQNNVNTELTKIKSDVNKVQSDVSKVQSNVNKVQSDVTEIKNSLNEILQLLKK